MKTLKNKQTGVLLSTVVLLTVGWFAVPHAWQEHAANDGFILFTTDRDNPSEAGICSDCEDIYVMAPDGSHPVRLTRGGADAVVRGPAYNSSGADWSDEQKLIAFQSNRVGGTPQVYLMRPGGGNPRVLLSLEIQWASGLDVQGTAFPSFSPTGNAVCFHSQDTLQTVTRLKRRDIYIANLDGTGLTNLTSPLGPGLAGDNIRCDWSPKGNAIAFTNGANGAQDIYAIDPDGTDLRRLTTADGNDANPAFSPDGDLIAFESNRDGTPEIYVMKADGTEDAERLTNFSAGPTPNNVAVSKPTWSPAGDRLAFHRRVGAQGARGHLEVYTMNADGTNVTQITFTPSPGFSGFPSWGKWSANSIRP